MLLQFTHNVLFEKLVQLKQNHHPVFDYKDYEFKGKTYRIFNYNLANYPSFKLDAALECRGVTFEIDSEGQFVELVSLPMQKFFNYQENPFTEGLEDEKILVAMDKQDGSLISTFLPIKYVHPLRVNNYRLLAVSLFFVWGITSVILIYMNSREIEYQSVFWIWVISNVLIFLVSLKRTFKL